MGHLSQDASDILEGIVLTNRGKTVAELVQMAKREDGLLGDEIREARIDNKELESYIADIHLIYKIA